MTKLRIIEHPNNPNRLLLQSNEDEAGWTKALLVYEYQLSRPLKTTNPDRDPLILQGAKAVSGNITGFADLSSANAFFESIPDAETYALSFGHNLADLLTQ